MDWMQLLRLGALLGQGNQQAAPTIATNMPGSPMVLNSAPALPTPAPPMPPDLSMPPVYPGMQESASTPTPDLRMPPVYPGTTGQPPDPFDRIMEMYQPPSSPANDELIRMYQNFPQRNNPGVVRKILGVLAAFNGGAPATEGVLYAPYYRELQDYMARMKPLEITARSEDRAEDNYRMMLLGAMQRAIQAQRAGTYDEVNQARIEKMQAEIERMAADTKRKQKEYELKEWVAKHPNHRFFWDAEGRLHGVDPKNNQEVIIEGIEGLTEEQKQTFIQNRQLAVEEARGANREDVGWQLLTGEDGQSYWVKRGHKPEPTGAGKATRLPSGGRGGSGPRPMTNLERIRQMQVNAAIILQKEPRLIPAITYEPATKVPLIKPGVLSRTEEEVLQRRLLNDVYDDDGNPYTHQNLGNRPANGGTVVPANSNKPQAATAPTTSSKTASKVPPEGIVWMIAPDGKTVGKVSVKEQKRLEGLGYKTIAKPAGAK